MSNEIRASPKRSYHFVAMLYPDSESYDCNEVLENLPKAFSEYAYILHDRDLNDDGTIKKPHYHVYGKRSQSTISSVAKALGIAPNYIQFCKSRRGDLRYLIHVDDPDKAQYLPEEVISNFDVLRVIDDLCEVKRVSMLLDYVSDGQEHNTLETCLFAIHSGCWSEYRRSYQIFKDILKEKKNYV